MLRNLMTSKWINPVCVSVVSKVYSLLQLQNQGMFFKYTFINFGVTKDFMVKNFHHFHTG